jgi:hypothetical protein
MTAPKLEYITRCRIPGCKKTFVSDPFGLEIIGKPGDRIVKFVSRLIEHAQTDHPQQWAQISGAIQQYMGFMIVRMFEIQDPQLLGMQEGIRAALHHFTTRLTITDEEIQSRVARIGLDPEQEEGVGLLLRDMRDLLTEQGQYAPQLSEKPLVRV